MTKKEAARWRWEFLRRDPRYREAYQEVLALRENAGKHPPSAKADKKGKLHPYFMTPAAQRERYHLKNFGCPTTTIIMVDPSKSFDDIMAKGTDLERESVRGRHVPPGVTRVLVMNGLKVPRGRLLIEVDLEAVNSVGAVKKAVNDMIQGAWAEHRKPKRTTDFERILKVGDLHEKGLTPPRIAERVFPEHFGDYDEDDDDAQPKDPENAVKMVRFLLKQYRQLVNGGSRGLTFP